MLNTNTRVFIAGHNGMVGSAVFRLLSSQGFDNLLVQTRSELDLRDHIKVRKFFEAEQPEIVIMAAARVGGIQANIDSPAQFIYDNLAIQNNLIHLSYEYRVKRCCFLGSSCIYPRECAQPMKEEYLLTGPLEPTNEAYAIAKITGLKMVEYYRKQYGFSAISLMPCNLYGTNDHFDFHRAHVLSALVRRFVDAVDKGVKDVTLWGSGAARREFMHVDDAAEAVLFMICHYDGPGFINIGSGKDITIKDLASIIAEEAGFAGRILWDTTKLDGMMRKCMDVSRMMELGFDPRISLREGIRKTIAEYRDLCRNDTDL